jgi:hypothetical protein
MNTETAVLLPVLLIDCGDSASPPQATGSLSIMPGLRSALAAMNTFSNPQDAVASLVRNTQERYGFGEMARLFDRFARTMNSTEPQRLAA